MTSNNHALHFTSAFTDGEQFRITPELLYREFLDISIAAMYLHCFFRYINTCFAREKFCHTCCFAVCFSSITKIGSFVGQETRSIRLHRHLCKFELDTLVVTDRSSKLLTLLCILYRCLECTLC